MKYFSHGIGSSRARLPGSPLSDDGRLSPSAPVRRGRPALLPARLHGAVERVRGRPGDDVAESGRQAERSC